ncbi:spermidine synthase [Paenibacillus solisilvae]|uniref:Spermidine synthase n=1 Tax=Paenibacillus solisilvae TaxID=2486751 RepID=A0ABW0W1P2_9BACL
MHILYQQTGSNHQITVYDTTELEGEKGNFRVLQFSNQAAQGAMDLDAPQRILFEYPRAMIHLMDFNNPSFQNLFIIGHGIGTIAGHYKDKQVKIAELDDNVVELSRRYFEYSQDNVIVGDGRRILEGEASHRYDYLILDAFTGKGTPRHLTTREFFSAARAKLDSQGAILMNVMGKGENDRLMNAIHTTLSGEFAYTKSFCLLSGGAAHDLQNIILMGSSRPIGFQLRQMAGFTEIEPGQGHIIMDSD